MLQNITDTLLGNNSVFSHQYKVVINGKELNELQSRMLQDIVVEQTVLSSSNAQVIFKDPEYSIIDTQIFTEDSTLQIFIGLDNKSIVEVFDGFISAIDLDFPSSGSVEVVLHCMDISHIMNREPKNRIFKDKTTSQIISSICSEYGLKSEIKSTTKKYATITQHEQTDLELIRSLVNDELELLIFYIENGTVFLKKRAIVDTSKFTFNYKTEDCSILSFKPRITKEVKRIKLEKSDINLDKKSTEQGKASDTTTSRDVSGNIVKGKNYRYVGNNEWEEQNE